MVKDWFPSFFVLFFLFTRLPFNTSFFSRNNSFSKRHSELEPRQSKKRYVTCSRDTFLMQSLKVVPTLPVTSIRVSPSIFLSPLEPPIEKLSSPRKKEKASYNGNEESYCTKENKVCTKVRVLYNTTWQSTMGQDRVRQGSDKAGQGREVRWAPSNSTLPFTSSNHPYRASLLTTDAHSFLTEKKWRTILFFWFDSAACCAMMWEGRSPVHSLLVGVAQSGQTLRRRAAFIFVSCWMMMRDARAFFFCGSDNGRECYTNFVIAFFHIFPFFSVGLSIKHQQDMNDTGKRESERGCVTGFFFAPDSGEQSEPCQR